MIKKTINRKLIYKTAAVLLALIVWQTAASVVNLDFILASPIKVAERLCTLWREEGFVSAILYSLLRISLGFSAGLVFGVLLAILSGRFEAAELIISPYLTAVKSVPIACFIILCLMWFSYSQLTVFVAFLIAFPVVYSNVLQGIKSSDAKLGEMADIFGIPWRRRLFYIYMPSVKPYLIGAAATSLGMSWKAGVAAEIMGVVKGSVGEKLYESKIYYENADLLAWTVIIVLLSAVMEKLVVLLMKLCFGALEKL